MTEFDMFVLGLCWELCRQT